MHAFASSGAVRRLLSLGMLALILLAPVTRSWAQPWSAEGPEVIHDGQVEGLGAQDDPVVGAVKVVAPVPGAPDEVILGTINGGIWRTTNFSNASPTWNWVTPNGTFPAAPIPVTPLSIGALSFTRNDATRAYAGLGLHSSFGRWGTAVAGPVGFPGMTTPIALLRSTDAGATWSRVNFAAGAGLEGVNITGVQSRGNNVVVVSGRQKDIDKVIGVPGGLWRSGDANLANASFNKVSGRHVCSLDTTTACDPTAMPDPCVAPAKGACVERNVCSGDQTTICDRTAMPDPCVVAANGVCGSLPAGDYTDVVNGPGNMSLMYTPVVNTRTAADTGIYRSTDAGQTWTAVYTGNTSPPAATNIFFCTEGPVVACDPMADPCPGAMNGTCTQRNIENIRIAGRDGLADPPTVYAAILTMMTTDDGDRGVGVTQVIRFGDAGFGAPTVDVMVPGQPGDAEAGVNPGGQGDLHVSIAGDPTDPNVVYVGGDRQTLPTEPNAIGAANYTGRLFRGTFDPTPPATTTWEPYTHDGTSLVTAPHADSRSSVFIGSVMYEGDDGGVYRQSDPSSGNGDWSSKIGSGLEITEVYAIAYDRISAILLGSSQDTGAWQQHATGSKTYDQIPHDEYPFLQGDGGVVAVDNLSLAPQQQSIRYASANNFSGFQRAVYNADNTPDDGPESLDQATERAADKTCRGGMDDGDVCMAPSDCDSMVCSDIVSVLNDESFSKTPPPFALNAVDPGNRMVAGTTPGDVWESMNGGDDFEEVAGSPVTGSVRIIIAGGRQCGAPNPEVLFVGTGAGKLYRRDTAGEALDELTQYTGGMPWDLVVDPEDWSHLFVVDVLNQRIFRSLDADEDDPDDVSFLNITNNLLAVAGAGFVPMTIEFINGSLAVGGLGGVYVANATVAAPNWALLGTGMPNAIVMDLNADPKSGLLFAGTLGRSIWSLSLLPPPPLPRHYECYETPARGFTSLPGVTLDDRFGQSVVTVRKRKRLCNPAVKNCEDPTASSDLEHLTGYVIKQTSPPAVPITNVPVTNQFGSFVLNLAKPDYLLVPAAKSLEEAPAPLVDPTIDHYKCYRVRNLQTRVAGLILTDQFTTLTFDVKKPLRFCVAADKAGEGVNDAAAALLCYKGRQTSLPRFRGLEPVFVDDQFGDATTSVDHLRELCVPTTSP